MHIDELLKQMALSNASDIYIKVGRPPILRVDGKPLPMELPDVTPEIVDQILNQIMTKDQKDHFNQVMEADLAYSLAGIGRFRINVFRQRGYTGIVMRLVKRPIFSFEELNLPPVIRELAELPRGLILVTGTTGSGKSTTLAAMLNHINNIRRCHVVTIEDPIEFVHEDNMSVFNQREVSIDTESFVEALRHVVRQAPDVIMIGEMRDLETIQTAISAAETGHLVLSTLHTIDATTTMERIINYFPSYLHSQIRMELAICLKGIVSMRLLPRASSIGRVPAMEILINTPSVRKLIMEGKTTSIGKYMEEGHHFGMQTFNMALVKLYQQKMITYEDALMASGNPDEFKLAIQGITSGVRSKAVQEGTQINQNSYE
jgi:twitching motility protein PilT